VNDPSPTSHDIAIRRWRLVLGRFAQPRLGEAGQTGSTHARMDRVLDYLYGREYRGRGVRQTGDDGKDRGNKDEGRRGGTEESVLAVPEWIHQVRELFPSDTVEIIQKHALDRYGMTELVTDAEVLRKLEPSYELLKAVLSFKGLMKGEVLEIARNIVRQVVEELRRKLSKDIRQALWGRLNKQHRSRLKVLRNLDWRRTIRANLKNYQPDRKQIVLGELHLFSRVDRHMPWHIIMAVDCSGSMMDSVIHSAIMAGIFKGLPALRVSLMAFDTSIVDLTEEVDDPTELLMSVQLGGGTNIAGAMQYCESLIRSPTRSIVVLVTDFYEGGNANELVASVKRICESGARVLGLAALDAVAEPAFDHEMAERCAEAGAQIAALTPQRLAQWMGQVIG
jgi:Mg-chelatase subunit ChlD